MGEEAGGGMEKRKRKRWRWMIQFQLLCSQGPHPVGRRRCYFSMHSTLWRKNNNREEVEKKKGMWFSSAIAVVWKPNLLPSLPLTLTSFTAFISSMSMTKVVSRNTWPLSISFVLLHLLLSLMILETFFIYLILLMLGQGTWPWFESWLFLKVLSFMLVKVLLASSCSPIPTMDRLLGSCSSTGAGFRQYLPLKPKPKGIRKTYLPHYLASTSSNQPAPEMGKQLPHTLWLLLLNTLFLRELQLLNNHPLLLNIIISCLLPSTKQLLYKGY